MGRGHGVQRSTSRCPPSASSMATSQTEIALTNTAPSFDACSMASIADADIALLSPSTTQIQTCVSKTVGRIRSFTRVPIFTDGADDVSMYGHRAGQAPERSPPCSSSPSNGVSFATGRPYRVTTTSCGFYATKKRGGRPIDDRPARIGLETRADSGQLSRSGGPASRRGASRTRRAQDHSTPFGQGSHQRW